jgi:PAS domain S-box-containing protein
MGMRIGELARRTGVGVSTLRAWESRFRFLDPARSAAGQRTYSEADVESVEAVVRLVAEGLTLAASITRVASAGTGALPDGEGEALLFGQILQVADQGIWVTKDGRTRYANRRMTEMMGYSLEELVAIPALDFIDPELLSITKERTEQVRAGHRLHFTMKLRRADRSTFLAELTTTPLLNAAGRYDGAVALVSDITARTQNDRNARTRHLQAETIALLGAQALRQGTNSHIAATQIVTEVVDNTRRLLGADRASMLDLIADAGELRLRAASPPIDEQIIVPTGSRSFPGYVVLARKAVVVDDTEYDKRFDRGEDPGAHPGSAIGAPVWGHAGIVGVLIAESSTPAGFDQEDFHFVQGMANIIGTAILD